MAFTFSGGLDLQKPNKPLPGAIKALTLPKYTVIDFSGDKKTVFNPFVSPGEAVCRYQCIGEHTTEDGEVPVYSGISGTVEEIIADADGRPAGIKIASDGGQTSAELEGYSGTLAELTPQTIIERVKKAAVPCRGNFGYAWRKMLAFSGKAKRFLLNFCESEPAVTSRRALIEEDLDEVLNGAKLLMKVLDLRRCEITVEKENRALISAVTEKTRKNLMFGIRKMKQKYPQDEETALIYALCGTRLSDADAPESLGCAVFDAEVAAAVYRAVAFGLPYCERVVTVESDNVLCPLGTPASELLDFCGVKYDKAVKLIFGGPLRGKALKRPDDPITAEADAITVIYEKDGSLIPEMTVCNRCGRCVGVCPSGILPYQTAELSKQKKYKKCVEYGALACCECGCCDYACPAYIPIKKLIQTAKRRLGEIKKNENIDPAAETAAKETETENVFDAVPEKTVETEPEITAGIAAADAETDEIKDIVDETNADERDETDKVFTESTDIVDEASAAECDETDAEPAETADTADGTSDGESGKADETDKSGEDPGKEPEEPDENGGGADDVTVENEDGGASEERTVANEEKTAENEGEGENEEKETV